MKRGEVRKRPGQDGEESCSLASEFGFDLALLSSEALFVVGTGSRAEFPATSKSDKDDGRANIISLRLSIVPQQQLAAAAAAAAPTSIVLSKSSASTL